MENNNIELIDKYKEWCNEFGKCEIETMSKDLTSAFIGLKLLEIDKKEVPDVLKNSPAYNLIEKRAEYINLKLNDYTKGLLSCIIDRPGVAVMYLYYIKSLVKLDEELNLSKFTLMFPYGFPTNESLEELWDKQKIDGDNLLDMLKF